MSNHDNITFKPASTYQNLEKNLDAHYGEESLQEKVGLPLTDMNEVLDPHLEDYFVNFWTSMIYTVVATFDPATLLPVLALLVTSSAERQLVSKLAFSTLQFSTQIHRDEPFARVLHHHNSGSGKSQFPPLFAALAVNFPTRSRVKANGAIKSIKTSDPRSGDDDKSSSNNFMMDIKMETLVQEVTGNCPKYFTARTIRPIFDDTNKNASALPRKPKTLINNGSSLNDRAREIINQASTAFIATRHLNNPDLSHHDVGLNHRGGNPGFIRVLDEESESSSSSSLILPDYSGNRFLQSLGNVESDKVAAVLFIDFRTGSTLHVQGKAENLVGQDAYSIMPLAPSPLITKIKVEKVTLIENSLNLELIDGEENFSPYNPPLRYLKNEQAGVDSSLSSSISAPQNTTTASNIPVTLVDFKEISPSVATFTFELQYDTINDNEQQQQQYRELEKVLATPASYAIFDCLKGGMLPPKKYQHMSDQKPSLVNDLGIRTWTVSKFDYGSSVTSSSTGTTSHDNNNNPRFDLTVRMKKSGVVTPRMFGILDMIKKQRIALPHKSFGMNLVGAGISNSFAQLVSKYYGVSPSSSSSSSSISPARRDRSDNDEKKNSGSSPSHHIWIAAGVGITPFYSLARSLLDHTPSPSSSSPPLDKVTAFVCLRKPDVALAQPLIEVAEQLKKGDGGGGGGGVDFQIRTIISPEDHITKDLIQETLGKDKNGDKHDRKVVFCGPLGLKKDLFSWLSELGLDSKDIVSESFDF